jgi:hypothetical protein
MSAPVRALIDGYDFNARVTNHVPLCFGPFNGRW